MQVWCVILLLPVVASSLTCNSTLTRKKRYLNFPAKAGFVFTISLLKGIASEAPSGPTTRLVTIHELDVFFPLPHEPSPYELTTATLGGFPVKHEDKHRRERREVLYNLEGLFDVKGYAGRTCILKALCEAKSLTVESEDDILMDILLSIFKMPEDDPDYGISEKSCLRHQQDCPVSIFDLAFRWAEQYLAENNKTTQN